MSEVIDDTPEGSRILLEMDYDKLIQSDIHNKTYWMVVTEAAIVAGRRKAACEIREEPQHSKRQFRSTRKRLKIHN